MPKKYYQRIATEDNCSYFWDYDKSKWQKICDVETKDVPHSVREGLKNDLEKERMELEMLNSIKI